MSLMHFLGYLIGLEPPARFSANRRARIAVRCGSVHGGHPVHAKPPGIRARS